MARFAVCVDFETHKTQPGLTAPPIVCGGVAWFDGAKVQGELLGRDAAVDALVGILEDERLIYVNANCAFDLLCAAVNIAGRGRNILPLIFKALRAGRVFDILIAEKLHAIANGHLGLTPHGRARYTPEGKKTEGYSLFNVLLDVAGRSDAKANDHFRTSYAELEHLPMEQWPIEARLYPVDDSCNTLEVALMQVGVLPRPAGHVWSERGEYCTVCGHVIDFSEAPPCKPRPVISRNLHDLAHQAEKHFGLHLAGSHGFRSDPVTTEALAAVALEGRESGMTRFIEAGLLRPDGTEDQAAVKRAVALAYGCRAVCGDCNGERRVWREEKDFSKKDPTKRVGKGKTCAECSGTGLALTDADVPKTDPSTKFPKGTVQIGRDQLTESGDDTLIEYAIYQEDDKITDTYIPFLRQGYHVPITLTPNLPLETGRVSYFGVAQLMPRELPARLRAKLKDRGL